jgi:hypothetical protein
MEAVAVYPYGKEDFSELADQFAELLGGTKQAHGDCETMHDILLPKHRRKVSIAQVDYRHSLDFGEGNDLAWIVLVMQDDSDKDNNLFYYIAISNKAPWKIDRVLGKLQEFAIDGLHAPEDRTYEMSDNPWPFGQFAGGIQPVKVKYDDVVKVGQE